MTRAVISVYRASHIKRSRATKLEVERRREILLEIVAEMKPMTVRQGAQRLRCLRGGVSAAPFHRVATFSEVACAAIHEQAATHPRVQEIEDCLRSVTKDLTS